MSFKLTLLISGFVLSPKKERLFPLEFNDSFEFLIEDTPVSLDDKGWFWLNELKLSKLCLSSPNWVFELPNSFILKYNHGSGMNIICTNKSIFNLSDAKLLLKQMEKY